MDPNQQPQIEHTFENPITPHLRVNWLLVIIIVVGFFGVLTAGYFLGTSSQKTKADKSVISPSPTEYVVPTTAVEPTRALVSDETAGWKTYKGTTYEFKYPPESQLLEIGSPNKNDCVMIKKGFAYLTIKTPAGLSGGCIQTGRGSYDKVTPVKENLKIASRSYTAEGNYVDSSLDPDANQKYSEFLRVENVSNVANFVVEYGGSFNLTDKNTYEQEKQVMKTSLSTFQFTSQ